jgi:hypothetical protein
MLCYDSHSVIASGSIAATAPQGRAVAAMQLRVRSVLGCAEHSIRQRTQCRGKYAKEGAYNKCVSDSAGAMSDTCALFCEEGH